MVYSLYFEFSFSVIYLVYIVYTFIMYLTKYQKYNYWHLLHQYFYGHNYIFSFSQQLQIPIEINYQIFLIIFVYKKLYIIQLSHEQYFLTISVTFILILFQLKLSKSSHQLSVYMVSENCNSHDRNLLSWLFVDCSFFVIIIKFIRIYNKQKSMEQVSYDRIGKIKHLSNKKGYYFYLIQNLEYEAVDLNLIYPEYQLVYNQNLNTFYNKLKKLNYIVPIFSSGCKSPLCFHDEKVLLNLIQYANNYQGQYTCPKCNTKNHLNTLFFDEQIEKISKIYDKRPLTNNKLSIRIKQNKWIQLPLKLNAEWKTIENTYSLPSLTSSNYVQLRKIIGQQVNQSNKETYLEQVQNYFQYNLIPQSSRISFLQLTKNSVIQQSCKLIGNTLYVGQDKIYTFFEIQPTRKQQNWLCYKFQNEIFVGLSSQMILYVSQLKYDSQTTNQETSQVIKSQLHIVCTCETLNKEQINIWINYEEVYIYDSFQHIRVSNILTRDNIEVDTNLLQTEKIIEKIWLIGQCWKDKYFISLGQQTLEIHQQNKPTKTLYVSQPLNSIQQITITEKYIQIIDYKKSIIIQINKKTLEIEKQCVILLQQSSNLNNIDKVIVFNSFVQWLQILKIQNKQQIFLRKAGIDVF